MNKCQLLINVCHINDDEQHNYSPAHQSAARQVVISTS